MDLWDGLVGYWSLDRYSYDQATHQLRDLSAEGNHGTSSGDNLGATFDFKINHRSIGSGATPFDGSSDFINCGTDLSLNGAKKTVSFWLNSSDLTSIKAVCGQRNTASTQLSWHIFSGITAKRLRFITSSNGTEGGASVLSSTDLNENTWYHVCCIADEVDVRIYINGELDSTPTSAAYSIFTSSADFKIGAISTTSEYFFSGMLSNFRMYSRALTQDEITWLYLERAGCYQTTSVMEALGKLVKINKERRLKV